MTIEERALKEYPIFDEEDYNEDKRIAFVEGATEQHKIDIEKACRLYEETLYQAKRIGIHGIPQMVNMFKQAMEE